MHRPASAPSCARFVQLAPGYARDVDVASVLSGLRKIVGDLEPQPRFRAAAEFLVETDCHSRRNAALTIDQVVEGLPRPPKTSAAAVIVKPSGSMQSCRTERPG